MKKVLCLLVFIAVSISCEDLAERLTVFEIDYNSEVTIPSTTVVNFPIDIATPPVKTDANSKFDSNNTSADLVDSIRLKSMQLEVERPEDGNFDFLEDLTVFIEAEGQEEVQIASVKEVADGNMVLNMEVSDVELKSYVIQDEFTLRVSTTTDKTIQQDHDVKIKTVFRVDANILGL